MDIASESVTGVADDLLLERDQEPSNLSIPEVISSYHTSLIKFLRNRLRVPEDAYDVAQEAYIRMMKYEGSKNIRSAPSMLFRIAANVAHDLGRANQSRRVKDHMPIDDLDIVSEQPSVERILCGEQKFEMVCDAIEHLPPKCRQVFVLSRIAGMTYPQIAAHCGISIKTVEKHISHALSICLQKVGDDRDQTSN